MTVRLSKRAQGGWDPEVLQRMRDDCDRHGVVLEAIRMDSDYIRLRKGPERDREIDTIVGNIRKAAQAGVKIITYNWEDGAVSPESKDLRSRRFRLRGLQAGRQLEESARRRSRTGEPRRLLGAHHLLPRTDHSCRQRE